MVGSLVFTSFGEKDREDPSFQWNSKVAGMVCLTGHQWGLDLDLATLNDGSINDKTHA